MDSNLTQVCRLCLENSDDSVNVFDKFQNSTIASILTEHFWFQVIKDDGMSEWLCQICWIQTKTFHNFYERIEFRHRNDCGSIKLVNLDEIKQERCITPRVSEPNVMLTKHEEDELDFETIDSEICRTQRKTTESFVVTKVESSFNWNDDQNDVSSQKEFPSQFTLGEDSLSQNDMCQPSISETTKNDDDGDPNDTNSRILQPRTKLKSSEIIEQNAQIREYFNMKCELCNDVEFETLVDAKKHYRGVHQMRAYVVCCGKKFWARSAIMNHILFHINPDAFRCYQCRKSFKDKRALEGHIKNHASFESRAFKCSLCSVSFTKKCFLKYHVQNQHSGETFPCDKCDKIFRSKLSLVQHIRGVHEYSLEHVCEICARRFKKNTILQSHIFSEHSTTPPPKAQCDICGIWLKHKLSLRKHMSRLHQNVAFNCPKCNKVSPNKAALTTHMKNTHGERCHQCVLCDKSFKRAKNLKEHIALHTGEYLYNCPYCDKKFKSNANMYSHRKKAHLAEWTRDFPQRVTLQNNSVNEEHEISK